MNRYQALVLAAGAGRRFGAAKQLANWRGRPLVQAAVESALAAPVDAVWVVLGAQGDAVAAALAPLADPRLRVVTAPDWAEGLAASLRTGILALPGDSRGVLVFLGDMPMVPPGLAARVLDGLGAGAPAVQPVHRGAPGHPTGLAAALYPDLLRLSGDAGAGALLKSRDDVLRLEVAEAGAVFDIDRPQDLSGPAD